MNLAELQRLFWQSVRREQPPPEIEAEFLPNAHMTATERVGLYRNMYWSRQALAIVHEFPKLAERIGKDQLKRLASYYILDYPSQEPAIEWIGQHFSEFLARRGEHDLADLAALEWARSRAHLAGDPSAVATAGDVIPSRFASTRLDFVPSLGIVHITSRALSLWDAPARSDATPPENGSRRDEVPVAVWRKDFDVVHIALEEDEASAFASARDGATMAEVCSRFTHTPESVERVFALFAQWLRRAWIARMVDSE